MIQIQVCVRRIDGLVMQYGSNIGDYPGCDRFTLEGKDAEDLVAMMQRSSKVNRVSGVLVETPSTSI